MVGLHGYAGLGCLRLRILDRLCFIEDCVAEAIFCEQIGVSAQLGVARDPEFSPGVLGEIIVRREYGGASA